jgi:hypothetical protein
MYFKEDVGYEYDWE